MDFKNAKVRKSLIFGYSSAIVIAAALIIGCLAMMKSQKDQYTDLMNREVASNEITLRIRLQAATAGRSYRDALLNPDRNNDDQIAAVEKSLQSMEIYLQSLDACFPEQLDPDQKDAYTDAVQVWTENVQKIVQLYQNYLSTGKSGYLEQAKNNIYRTDSSLQSAMIAAGETLVEQLSAGLEQKLAEIQKSVVAAIIVMLVILLVAIGFVIKFVLFLISSIVTPVEQVRDVLVGYSQGNLKVPVEFQSGSELGEMCDAVRQSQRTLSGVIEDTEYMLGEMARGNFTLQFRDESLFVGELAPMREAIRGINYQLSDTLAQITMSAEQVSAGADQVSTGAQALALGATEQASAVEELSATVSEIAQMSRTNAGNSGDALRQTQFAGDRLDESARRMEEMVAAMQRISESSEQIGRIIGTIENIAFQTNLLALNASIEAARAGEAGRGFTVIANEVRKLAAKSDEAARSTADLIDSSMDAVREGTRIVDRVSVALNQTVEATEELKRSIGGIAQAVEKEAAAIGQVNQGIEQISSVVQTNSATSEESAAASQELTGQAALIKELMRQFTLRSTDEADSGPMEEIAVSAEEEALEPESSELESEPEIPEMLEVPEVPEIPEVSEDLEVSEISETSDDLEVTEISETSDDLEVSGDQMPLCQDEVETGL